MADGWLGDLSALGPRTVRNLYEPCWHMPWGCVRPDLGPDPITEGVVEAQAFAQTNEENDARIAVPVLPDHDRLHDLLKLLDLTIYLGSADAYTARIQCRVGAALDHYPAGLRPLGPVPMAPHPGKPPEKLGRASCRARGCQNG